MAGKGNHKVSKIKKYRKPLNINIGMIIFAAIFLYICICIMMYFKDNHIKPYEVREGSLSSTNLYTGIVLRQETAVNANKAGYVNYYAQEGERVAVGNLVYTIDETGKLSDYISSDKLGENTLSDKDLKQLKSEMTNFVHGFSATDFSTVYDLKYRIKGNALKLANTSLMESISDLKGTDLGAIVNLSYATETGIIMYWTDGYESLTADQVTSSMLSKEDYEKKQLLSNELVSEQDTVYKICANENWSILIQVDDAKAQELLDAEYVKVRFMKNQDESWASVQILHNEDGNTYAQLSFTNSMVSYASDRFLEIELLLHEEKGLKIPNSSIVEMEFYLIPEKYVTQSGDTDSYGVLREAVLEDGTRSTEYVEISIYSNVDGEYYVDADVLKSGDHLYQTDSTESFTISKRATLIGVYNMNKGYADFKQINILYQNNEYAIVKSNTDYGLNVYDLIVQDASIVKDEQFIYK
ncbi:MAG TPA: HlyD family efflux transporter periplasmic adaptor subunit [Lachnospiraceae bacterium]|nr:HlyD family efflux transporter periplasmic adaptor subunit [Lachnospiraceae bacterium]